MNVCVSYVLSDVRERMRPMDTLAHYVCMYMYINTYMHVYGRYMPVVDDINKRIKIQITPVRADGLEGPTYQVPSSPRERERENIYI